MKNLALNDPAFLAPFGTSPDKYGGLVRWWDAGSLTYSDGTAIDNGSNKWTDKSSTADHAIQATASKQPVCKTAIQNGLRAILFDPLNSQELEFTALSNLTAITVMAVLKNSETNQGTLGFLKHSTELTDLHLSIDVAGDLTFVFQDDDGGTEVETSSTFAADTTAAFCLGFSVDNGGTNNLDFREGATGRGNFSFGSTDISMNRIGAVAGAYWNGYMMEICVWNQKRTTAEMDNLFNNYFKARWGL